MTAYPRFVYSSRLEGLAPGAFTASSTATGFLPANVKDRREYIAWKTAATGAQWLRIDLGAPVSFRALCLAGHNLASQGITNVNLTADNVGGAGHPLVNSVVPNFTPTTDRALAKFFTPVSYRYCELGFTVPVGAAAEIGVMFLSDNYLEVPALVQNGFDPDRQRGFYSDMLGDAGHLTGIVEKFKQREFDIRFENIVPAWVESDYWPFINTNGRKPFFFAWEYLTRPDEVSYVRITDEYISTPYNDVWQTLSLALAGRFDAQ